MATSAPADRDYRLFFAVKQGNASQVLRLLMTRADVNQGDEDGRTPLYVATIKRQNTIVDLLLRHQGIDVDARANCGHTALSKACESGDLQIVQLLLSGGASVNVKNNCGQRPLDIACYHGNTNIINLLLNDDQNSDVNLCQVHAPLHWAVKGCHLNAVQLLLHAASHLNLDVNVMNINGNTPLHIACMEGFHEIAHELIQNTRVDVNCENKINETPLHIACKYKRVHVLSSLLTRYPDANLFDLNGLTALHVAVDMNSKDCIVPLILHSDVYIDAKDLCGRTPLFLACDRGYEDIIKILINNGADVNTHEKTRATPLCEATLEGKGTVIDCLLQSGNIHLDIKIKALAIALDLCYETIARTLIRCIPDINMRYDKERTPLFLASVRGLQYLVSDILDTPGREINSVSETGTTPFHIASLHGQEEVVKLLIKHNANVDMITNTHMTALHMAIYNGHLKVAKTLSMIVRRLNQRDVYGHTALYLACDLGYTDVVKTLLHRGADAHIANFDKRTPLHMACAKGHENIAEMLLQAGARVSDANREGLTALHCAVSNPGDVDYLVRLLMQKGADCNVQDCHGNNPVNMAYTTGHETAMQIMRRYHNPGSL